MHQKSSSGKKTRRSRYAATHGKNPPASHIALRRNLLRKVAEERTIPEHNLQWIGGILYRFAGEWMEVSGVQRVPKPGQVAVGIVGAGAPPPPTTRRVAETRSQQVGPPPLALDAWRL